MTKLRVLDLFSGIGGFSLGLERTGGFETVAFCEIEPFPRRVLAKHWPNVPIYEDVRTLDATRLAADGIGVDVICGGFPCQDISHAGAGAGLDGARSGLWSEIARLAGELRPRFVIVENVAALLGRGLDRVLGDLAAIGYDAEWHCIPASYVGAPHRRDRIWIVAYPGSQQHESHSDAVEGTRTSQLPETDLAYPNGEGELQQGGFIGQGWRRARDSRQDVADACEPGLPASERGWWAVEPDVGRMAHGVPRRVDRLKALGNAVVPQIPEMIGRAILAAE